MSSISDWLGLCMEKVKLAAEKTHFEQERAAWAEKCAREEQFKMEQCKKEIHCENFKSKEVRICRTCKYNHLDHYCSRKEGCCGADFLGWEPVEPKEERECKTCNHGSWNNPTKTYCIKACINFSLWEPVEKKAPKCEECRHFSKIFQLCSTDRGVVDTYLARNDENFCGSSHRWFEPDRRSGERRKNEKD